MRILAEMFGQLLVLLFPVALLALLWWLTEIVPRLRGVRMLRRCIRRRIRQIKRKARQFRQG